MNHEEKDVFCKIIAGEIPSQKEYEDDQVIAINDIEPKAPIHILIIPKKHIVSLNEITDTDEQLIGHMIAIGSKLAHEKGISETGYRLVFNTGPHAGQTVPHIHLHLLGGQPSGRMSS